MRDQAVILDSLIVLGDLDRAGALARSVSEQLASGRWYSTQSTAYGLLAMGRLAGADKSGAAFSFEYGVGEGTSKKIRADKPIHLTELESFPDAGTVVRVRNTSDKPIFVDVLTRGAARAGEEKAAAAGLEVEASYADQDGSALDPTQILQGTDFVVRVSVTNVTERKLDHLALSHIAASGWEIHNSRLGSEQAKAPAGIDYQDIRDDRVYSYFSLAPRERKTLEVRFNAAYLGSYYLPAISVEPMYDASKHARTKGQWVKVVRAGR
jgi:hypothetical protein